MNNLQLINRDTYIEASSCALDHASFLFKDTVYALSCVSDLIERDTLPLKSRQQCEDGTQETFIVG